MSINQGTLVASLASVDVDSVRVERVGLDAAIDEFVVGDAVGIVDESWGDERPESVNWNPTPADLQAAETGVTTAAFAIANYGSLVLTTESPAAELVSLYVDRHVVIVTESDIVPDMDAAFDRLDEEIPESYSDAIIETGPSATADMGALVKGAHGPSKVCVVVVED